MNLRNERAITVVSGVVALAFFAAGLAKLTGAEQMVATFQRFGLSPTFMWLIGVAELAGAVGLFLPRTAPLAAAGLAAIMAGAVTQHLMHDPALHALPAATLLVLCGYLMYARRPSPVGLGGQTVSHHRQVQS